ncbi:MAG: type I DNA topoisomerase [Deltaproteobacteria bacterium]|nr:MAG: type I DNA topoisomerase [Deltaproteobacteria bacterium]
MSKSLLIVESPAKARTIKRYLGKDFIVEASVGHVKDLPKSTLGVDVEHGFAPQYGVIRGKGKVISALKKAAGEADEIYLAPDPDREGEAIAWHIADEIRPKKDDKPIHRVMIHEITKKGVQEAIAHPSELNEDIYNAQQARRILDRLVGYQISPILWRKVKRGLSAGRVQSVALRLVVEREAEIKAFVPEEYWNLKATLAGDIPPEFVAKLSKIEGKKAKIANAEEAAGIKAEVELARFDLAKVEKRQQKRNPSPPFITSTLQREASLKLGFSAKKTMMIAQRLYEGVDVEGEPVGLITYMRTDSTRLSADAVTSVREYIAKKYGDEMVPSSPVQYKAKKSAQDAHEAIRPTHIYYPPEAVKDFLDRDQYRLYKLVWERFVACQMKPAIYDRTTFIINAGRFELRASGSILRFKGFMALYVEDMEANGGDEESENDEGRILPDLSEGAPLKLKKSETSQHFTQPPPRFTESSLVKELEEQGIGRPSTYASILSTIRDKGYVEMSERKFVPTDLGALVCELLVKNFPDVFDVGFTASMEESLDEVEGGKRDWRELLANFYQPFEKSLEKAEEEMENVRARTEETDIECDQCGSKMVIRWGRNGFFLACSEYPSCRNAKGFERKPDGTIEVSEGEKLDESCPECGKPLLIRQGRRGRFVACSGYPDCKFTRPVGTGVACPGVDGKSCEGELVEKQSKTGRVFYACNKYPDCTYALWDRPITRECPECKNPFLVEKFTKNGTQIRCPQKGCGYKEQGD